MITLTILECKSYFGDKNLFERGIYRGSSIRVVEKEYFCYPLLSNVAIRYLIIPTTLALSEILFSTAGHIANQKHAYLLSENITMLVFLAENLQ